MSRAAKSFLGFGIRLIVAERLTIGRFNALVADATGVRHPRLSMPDWLVAANAAALTFAGNVPGLRLMLGMSADQIRMIR